MLDKMNSELGNNAIDIIENKAAFLKPLSGRVRKAKTQGKFLANKNAKLRSNEHSKETSARGNDDQPYVSEQIEMFSPMANPKNRLNTMSQMLKTDRVSVNVSRGKTNKYDSKGS